MPYSAPRTATIALIDDARELCHATGRSVSETREMIAESRIMIARSMTLLQRVNRLIHPEGSRGA